MQVLKLGGSVLTKKNGYMELDRKNIDSLAEMLGGAWKSGVRDFILIHGAGSFGHPLVLKYGLEKGVRTEAQKGGMALTHAACTRLSQSVVDALLKNGVPAVAVPPASLGKLSNGRISELDSGIALSLLSSGFLPVLHGDMMLDEKRGGSVCSGDQLVSYFGKGAERVILGTDVDGIIADGKVVPLITKANVSEVLAHVKGAETADVTGGMRGKLEELLGIGKPAYIANALHPERIEKLLRGEKAVCTLVE
ncbi:MAG: isopentenyl phosphate kinase [Candidatus ainarchaeum sp.]|nr:isopentenyl phosphate kinase [Candidatus ainarchaeum sp.]MDD5096637.1 isopentenyl phosphate kinase [Candidatus ainarchaeum sp.]